MLNSFLISICELVAFSLILCYMSRVVAFRAALPQPADSDWSRLKPRHPVATPPTFPKTAPDVISAPALFRKMDPEALFFAFYYQPDTYQQYLAAQVGAPRLCWV